ncbi:MAG: tetratricopeptide repeat protein [Candidatus Acidiferrales bacterium]
MALRQAVAGFVLIASLAAVAPAQEPSSPTPTEIGCQLYGRVYYANTYRPAVGALVRAQSRSVSMLQQFTNTLGRYNFDRLPADIFTVEVSVEGFRTARVEHDLSMLCRVEASPLALEPESKESSLPAEAMVSATDLRVPPKAREALELGIEELYDRNRPGQSLSYFRQALDLYPDYDQAYVQLAVAHTRQAKFSDAQQALEKATALNNKNARAFFLLGFVHGKQGHSVEGLRALRESIRLDNTYWRAHFELGAALLQLGLTDDALRHAERAHRLKPDTPQVHLLLHDVLVRRQDYPAALAEVDEFLQLFPKDRLSARALKQQEWLRQSVALKQPQ